MKIVFERSNGMWTGQIVLREDGKYVVRHEGVLTCDEAKAVVVEHG